MSKTQSELVEHVLKDEIGVIDAVQPIPPEDSVTVGKIYLIKLEQCRNRGLVYWDSNAIPEAVFSSLAKLVAWAISPGYGKKVDKDLPFDQQPGVSDLQIHIAIGPTGEPTEALYF